MKHLARALFYPMYFRLFCITTSIKIFLLFISIQFTFCFQALNTMFPGWKRNSFLLKAHASSSKCVLVELKPFPKTSTSEFFYQANDTTNEQSLVETSISVGQDKENVSEKSYWIAQLRVLANGKLNQNYLDTRIKQLQNTESFQLFLGRTAELASLIKRVQGNFDPKVDCFLRVVKATLVEVANEIAKSRLYTISNKERKTLQPTENQLKNEKERF